MCQMKSVLFLIMFIMMTGALSWAAEQEAADRIMESAAAMGGVIKPENTAVLSFSQSGPIIFLAQEGDMLEKGAVVGRLEDTKLKNALKQAEAILENSRISLETVIHNRNKTLRLLNEKILAPIALTESDFNLKKAESEVKLSEIRLEMAKLSLADTVMKAPFKGVVTKVYAGIGQTVHPGAAIMEIVDLVHLKLTVDIPLSMTTHLKPGTTTSIIIDKHVAGTASVKTLLPMIDPASGLRRVIWKVHSDADIIAGRYATLSPWE